MLSGLISFLSCFYFHCITTTRSLVRYRNTLYWTSCGSVVVTVIWSWAGQHLWLILFNLPYDRWVWNILCGLINFTFVSFQNFSQLVFESSFLRNAMSGSFSRSAVNHESGAKTGLSGLVMGIIMGCALLFLTPVFEYIPQVKEFVWGCKVFTWLSVTRLLSNFTAFGAVFPVSLPLSWLQFVMYAMGSNHNYDAGG